MVWWDWASTMPLTSPATGEAWPPMRKLLRDGQYPDSVCVHASGPWDQKHNENWLAFLEGWGLHVLLSSCASDARHPQDESSLVICSLPWLLPYSLLPAEGWE